MCPWQKESLHREILGWPKSSFRFFCSILWKNLNELFGQPNISVEHSTEEVEFCLIFKDE